MNKSPLYNVASSIANVDRSSEGGGSRRSGMAMVDGRLSRLSSLHLLPELSLAVGPAQAGAALSLVLALERQRSYNN